MLECAVYLIVYAIIGAILLWAIEAVLGAFGMTPPPPILTLIRVLIVLLVAIAMLNCLGVGGPLSFGHRCP